MIKEWCWLSNQRLSGVSSTMCSRHLDTKFIIGFDFAVTLSTPESFCVLFDITLEQSVELKWLMLNKHKRWFHSSRVKFPLVSMSASWFLVSIFLIWILGSTLIRSNNQSRATLWALETCLIVGLLPFIIILITASLSSNTYNKAAWCEDWTFEGTQSMLFSTLVFPWDLWFIQISFMRNDWMFHTGPWLGPFVFWVDESKFLDILTKEFLNNDGVSSILTWV